MTKYFKIPANVSREQMKEIEASLIGIPSEAFETFFLMGDMIDEPGLNYPWESVYNENRELFQKHGVNAFDGVI